MKSVTIVGAGAVGRSIALALFYNRVKIDGIYSESGKSARSLAKKVHCNNFGTLTVNSLLSKIIIIAVPDDRIRITAVLLGKNPRLLKSKTVFHTSGALTSDELAAVRKRGAVVASFHPLQTFSRSKNETPLKNIWCAVEGDKKAIATARVLGNKLRMNIFTIAKKDKPLYHAAAVFASNYLITLLSVVEELSDHIRIPKKNIWKIYSPLILQTIHNAIHSSPAAALTGPIVRGDTETIKKHIKALSIPSLNHLAMLYSVLGIETTRLVKGKNAR
ncbi:MAG: DUF2520 domain-containing protein [Bacteroidota bacterium]|nr:DUF2520 domain-containing protein [Bacteroidota bacterium]